MPTFALVDCNNFYASCERVFNPALENKPVVILSNNDGCIIARSNEAKRLGIPMGAAYFEWKALCLKHRVNVFSSNYTLYGDMSQRVMSTLAYFCPDIEVYSIDEAFLNLSSFTDLNLHTYATNLREKVRMWVGLPVSVGIGPTKTLAKLANLIAKKHTASNVFDLTDPVQRERVLQKIAVGDIWGIGRRIAAKLNARQIFTAADLCQADLKVLRRQFSVVVEKTISELRGISCLPLEFFQPRQQIMFSRSFGRGVYEISELEDAISHYSAKASIKLRAQHSIASAIHIFMHTSLFKEDEAHYANSITIQFLSATNDSRKIIHAAIQGIRKMYKPGFRYQKVGMALLHLLPDSTQQFDLLETDNKAQTDKIMQTLDDINKKIGKGTLFFLAEGVDRQWQNRRDLRSPRYTTNWQELPIIR